MHRAMGFAALLVLLTTISLRILIAGVSPAPHHGLAVWVVYGMGLTGSFADAVTQIFSALARAGRRFAGSRPAAKRVSTSCRRVRGPMLPGACRMWRGCSRCPR